MKAKFSVCVRPDLLYFSSEMLGTPDPWGGFTEGEYNLQDFIHDLQSDISCLSE